MKPMGGVDGVASRKIHRESIQSPAEVRGHPTDAQER